MKSPASSLESHSHGKVPTQRCDLTRDMIPRQKPRRNKRKAWDGRQDLAVDLTIAHLNPATGRPLLGSAATFLRDKGEQKNRESADSCGRLGVDFSPMVFDTREASTELGRTW